MIRIILYIPAGRKLAASGIIIIQMVKRQPAGRELEASGTT